MVRRVATALIVSLALPGFVVVPTAAWSQDRSAPKPPGGQPPAPVAGAVAGASGAAPAAGLALQSLDVAAERDKPEACFTFNQPLARRQGGADPVAARVEVEDVAADARAGDKAAARPAAPGPAAGPSPGQGKAAPHALVIRDATICVEGLEHGGHYRITLKAGLPAADGVTTLAAPLVRDVTVSDRAPSLAFRGAGYILPRIGADGLPLRTVNVARAGLRVLRINDPALVEQVYSGRVNQTLNERDVGSLVEKNSTLVWRGEMAVGDRRNQAVTTPFPIDAVLGQLKPGVYVAVAEAAAEKPSLVAAPWDSHPKAKAPAAGWEGRATQWFIVSDIGLTTFTASNGLFVHVHSLQSAQPLGGVELRVVGRNNQELARATTAADGTAHIDAAALQGKAQALFATTRDGDYSLLDLTAPGMALAGRGGGGRAVTGPVDAYVYADRGIYRPGETVRVTALLRDLSAAAVSGRSLTLKVQRPDGLEVDRQTLTDRGLGGYSTHVDLPGNAYPGVWTITVHADPDGPAVGRLRFSVADFVPPRIDLDLSADRARIGGDGALTLTVNGRTPVGTPAANLAGSLTALVRPAADPFPAFRDYHFGPADIAAAPVTETLPGFTTDANGAATLSLSLKDKLGGGLPLEAVIRASLFDVGGGANDHELVLPVDRLPYAIGIRPRFADDAVPEGAIAGFDVVAVAPDGHPLDKTGLSYELYEERFDYVWFEANGAWDYKSQVHDVKLTGGGLTVGAKAPGGVEVPVTSGRYRLEVTDPATGIVSAVRFSAGAWVSARLGATPDKVEISVKDGPAQPGKAASVFIRPPYRSTVLINVADGAIRHSLVQEIGPEGAVVDVPMDADLTGGAYVLATAFAPADNGRRTASRRAIGAAWVPEAMTAHTLVPHIDGPAEIRSRQQVRIPVAVSGATPGQSVYMTFSAVDETVLDLTDFKSPDPAAWFYGQRALGVEVRDVYGRLTPSRTTDGPDDPARRAPGADHPDAKRLLGLPPRGAPVVAQYSGILTVAADGRVSVPLSVPDFQGRLRLMATVWSAGAVGHGERTLAVHDPVLATVSLPRFLAPGDKAAVTVAVDNAAGPRGAYTVILQAEGPLELPGAGALKAKKAARSGKADKAAHGGKADKAARSNKADKAARGGAKEDRIPAALREAVVTFPHLGKGERATAVRTLTAAASGTGRLVMTLKGPDGITLVRDFTLPVRTALPHVIRHDTAEVRPGQTVSLTSETAQGLRSETVAAGLAVSALPELDVPGLLLSLEAEGAGSAEAIASDTLPLLYYGDALRELGRLSATPAGAAPPVAGAAAQPPAVDAPLRQRVDRAIDKILSLERADGGFGLWSPDTPADPWLTAYVLDFLTRARQAGYSVADAPYRKGLDWLAHTVGNNWVEPAELPGRAYALLVGAQTRVLDASAVRFFFQTYFDKLPTVAARAQVAAALAAVGANDQAQDAFNRLGATRTALPGLRDFGSPLRDQALVLALMADNGVAIDRLAATARQIQGQGVDPALVSGQERAWLLLAAKGLSQRAAPMTLGFAGQAPSATGFVVRHVDPAARPVTLLNGGQQPVQRTLAVSGIPAAVSAAKGKADDAHQGVTVERRYYDLKGHPVDPARIRQGDLLAVVVAGKAAAPAAGGPDSAASLLVVDPLPAGLGIETVGLGRGALPADLAAAVGDVNDAAHVEARDDRYVAAVDLPAGQSAFKLVYLVRAIVPGSYLLPPTQVRDMTTAARGGEGQAGALTVLPADGAVP